MKCNVFCWSPSLCFSWRDSCFTFLDVSAAVPACPRSPPPPALPVSFSGLADIRNKFRAWNFCIQKQQSSSALYKQRCFNPWLPMVLLAPLAKLISIESQINCLTFAWSVKGAGEEWRGVTLAFCKLLKQISSKFNLISFAAAAFGQHINYCCCSLSIFRLFISLSHSLSLSLWVYF